MRANIRENVDLVIETTAGRVIFNERLTRDGLPFVNGTLKKKGLQSLVTFCHLKLGHEQTVIMLDDLYRTVRAVQIGRRTMRVAWQAIGIGLLYRRGYFRQQIDADGHQEHAQPDLDPSQLPLRRARGRDGLTHLVKNARERLVGDRRLVLPERGHIDAAVLVVGMKPCCSWR